MQVKVCIIDSGVTLHEDLDVQECVSYLHRDGIQRPGCNSVDGHGTHVAGILGALTNNGRGVAGVAWKVQRMPPGCDAICTARLPACLMQLT